MNRFTFFLNEIFVVFLKWIVLLSRDNGVKRLWKFIFIIIKHLKINWWFVNNQRRIKG